MNGRIDDLIALAALGELNEQESAELDAAVAADPAVADELAEALASAAALQSSPVEPPPPHAEGVGDGRPLPACRSCRRSSRPRSPAAVPRR